MAIVEIHDSFMNHTEAGAGRPVVFLHGNPTSGYVWRNVIPHVTGQARALAPDLIGMGDSGKPDIGYRFVDHVHYLDAWFDAVGLDEVVIVGTDWGGALGMDWAARHPDRIKGIVLFETFLRPMTWAEYPPNGARIFQDIRGPEGERLVLEQNQFIEFNLPHGVVSGLSEADHDVYRAPYPDPASRKPLLVWPREIPIDGTPADVHDRVLNYVDWAKNSPEVPKLLLTAEPGSPLGKANNEWARTAYANIEVQSIGTAGHNASEDQPDAIGQAIARWLTMHP